MSSDPKRPRPNCACSSYQFPHRAGAGRCACSVVWQRHSYHLVPGDRGPDFWRIDELCASCGQPAELKAMDFGIGAYEFWGSPGVDVDIQYVTECCEVATVPNTWSERIKLKWSVQCPPKPL